MRESVIQKAEIPHLVTDSGSRVAWRGSRDVASLKVMGGGEFWEFADEKWREDTNGDSWKLPEKGIEIICP